MKELDKFIRESNIPDLECCVLEYVMKNCPELTEPNKNLWIEFGVFQGRTINKMAKHTTKKVFGFDSFEGLPEKWRKGFEKGAFNTNGRMPKVEKNVRLIKGWFCDTLPSFMEKRKNCNIGLLHIDCDLYSSTKYIFDTLKHNIKPGCIIVFDELVNYEGYDGDNGELRAWVEFIQENNVSFEFVGMNGKLGDKGASHESVAVRIISIN